MMVGKYVFDIMFSRTSAGKQIILSLDCIHRIGVLNYAYDDAFSSQNYEINWSSCHSISILFLKSHFGRYIANIMSLR